MFVLLLPAVQTSEPQIEASAVDTFLDLLISRAQHAVSLASLTSLTSLTSLSSLASLSSGLPSHEAYLFECNVSHLPLVEPSSYLGQASAAAASRVWQCVFPSSLPSPSLPLPLFASVTPSSDADAWNVIDAVAHQVLTTAGQPFPSGAASKKVTYSDDEIAVISSDLCVSQSVSVAVIQNQLEKANLFHFGLIVYRNLLSQLPVELSDFEFVLESSDSFSVDIDCSVYSW